eukprot:scaffold60957_cov72-Phaeocystis_antarctica.AAC.3
MGAREEGDRVRAAGLRARAVSRLCLGHVPAVGVAAEQRQVAGHTARGVLRHQDEGRPGAEHHQ